MAKFKVRLEPTDSAATLFSLNESRFIFNYYAHSIHPIGILLSGKHYFLKSSTLYKLYNQDIGLDTVLRDIEEYRLSQEEIQSITKSWVKIELEKKKAITETSK